MPAKYDFSEHLRRFGPETVRNGPEVSLAEADAYCWSIATGHEENFPVLSFAVPKYLRHDFARVYAYCRWADDLGDEIGSPVRSLELLDWWREEVELMYAGTPHHPVMVALAETVTKYHIPSQPFLDLISAFRQDQTVCRYVRWEELLDYCRRSADPVGRIVLYLLRSAAPENFMLSDKVCTGLQLANFWQDVSVDYFEKGRIYLPLSACDRHGVTEDQIRRRQFTPGFVSLMTEVVDEADDWLAEGLALRHRLKGRFALAVSLFGEGGRAILRRIRRDGYNVLAARRRLRRSERAGALARAVWGLFMKSRTSSEKSTAGIVG